MNEQEMRDSVAPTLDTLDELSQYIDGLVNQEHDYGTCVYAMSLAATAAFNYVARKLGVSGFQASCADLDILKRTRNMKGPFLIVDGENVLYPQYDLHARLDEFLDELKPWAAEEAQKLLDGESMAVDAVKDHWRKLTEVEVSAKTGDE